MIQLAERRTPAALMKIAAVAVIAMLALVLSACSGGGEKQEATFTMSDGGVEVTLVYYAEGDEVYRQTTRNVINYEEAGIDEELAREILEPLMEEFQGIDGLKHSIEFGADEAIEEMDVDYNTASMKEISQLMGSSFSGNVDDNTRLSLEQSREMLLAQGYTEVK